MVAGYLGSLGPRMSPMTHVRALAAILAYSIPCIGASQSLGYQDADTPSEAVGMMKVSIVVAEVMRSECIARFPNEQGTFDQDLNSWKTKESVVLKRTEEAWASMLKREPDLATTIALAEKAVKANFELLSQLPQQPVTEVQLQYCRKHFRELATGVSRQRIPKAYMFLEQSP